MMGQDVFTLLVAQTWQVAVVAILSWIAVRLFATDRPHLAHAIWALVLLKCIIPPVLSSPVSPFSWMASHVSQNLQDIDSVRQDEGNLRASPAADSTDLTRNSLTIGVPLKAQDRPAVPPETSLATTKSSHLSNVTESSELAPKAADQTNKAFSRETEQHPQRSWSTVVVWVWLAGAAIGLAVMTIRFTLFVAWLRKSPAPAVGHVETIVEQLRQRLKIRSAIRIKVSERPVGPAVIGLLRPTILLPMALIENKTSEEIEPLIAHELIHVRRGDLWWAMLQTVTTSLFWFHPLVWIASKMLTIESERSCDEETIAGLGCRPADYARGLLEVLEQKQQLRVAPALPGVRPVEITSARLERVMKLGNGIRNRTPLWVWLVMLVCAAIVLPGAAWAVAQEKATPGTKTKVGEPTDLIASSALTESKQDNQYQEHRFEIGDLLRQIRERSVVKHSAESILISALSIFEQIADPGEGLKITHGFTRLRGARISGNQLIANETPERIKTIQNSIDHYREYGFDQVVAETHFLRINQEQLNKLGIEWQQVKSDAFAGAIPTVVSDDSGKKPNLGLPKLGLPNRTGIHAVTHIDRGTPVLYSVVSEMDLQRIIKMTTNGETGKSTKMLHNSNVTVFNGRDAEVSAVFQRAFVTAVKEVVAAESGSKAHQPIISVFETGTRMRIRPVLKGDMIEVDCHVQLKEVSDVKLLQLYQRESKGSETVFHKFDEKAPVQSVSAIPESNGERIVPPTGYLFGGGTEGVSIQSPTVIATNVEVKRSVKLGETLLLQMLSNDPSSETDTVVAMLTCRKISCEWEKTSDAEKKQAADRAAAIAAAKKLPDVVKDNQVERDVLVIKAGGGDQASDVEPREFQVMGMKFKLEGDVKFEIRDSGIKISGKQLSFSMRDQCMGSCEEGGTIEFGFDEAGEAVSAKVRLTGQGKIRIGDRAETTCAADSIRISTDEDGIEGTLEGNVRFHYVGFTGLADRVSFDDTGVVTLSGRASLFGNVDGQPSTGVRGEKILIDGELKTTVDPDDAENALPN